MIKVKDAQGNDAYFDPREVTFVYQTLVQNKLLAVIAFKSGGNLATSETLDTIVRETNEALNAAK